MAASAAAPAAVPADKKRKAQVSSQKQRPAPRPQSNRDVPQSQGLSNMFQVLKGQNQPMQTSEQGVSYRDVVSPAGPSKDPGYLRPPTRQDIEYGDRLQKAMKQKETGSYPNAGIDPVLLEQRITAAERQPHGPGWEKAMGGPMRTDQYGPSTLQNVGDFLGDSYSKTLGTMVPFAYGPGGGIYESQWRQQGNDALPMLRGDIESGRGTEADQSRRSYRERAAYGHKYYGLPEPGPRKSNVYDTLGMPQPKEYVPAYDYGQGDVPYYLTGAGRDYDIDHGPAKTPPPGSELGLPAGALATRGVDEHLTSEARNRILSGDVNVQDLPPKIQRFIKNTIEKPRTTFGGPGGGGGGGGGEGGEGTKKKKGEKKETFNLLKMLLGLLGLPLKLFGLDGGFGQKEEGTESSGSGDNRAYNQMVQERKNNDYYRQRFQALRSRERTAPSGAPSGSPSGTTKK